MTDHQPQDFIDWITGEVPSVVSQAADNDAASHTRPNTVARWYAALDRARANITLYRSDDGQFNATSSRNPNTLYPVGATRCACEAAVNGDPVCQHRAAVRSHLGLAPFEDQSCREPVAAPEPVIKRECRDCLGTGSARISTGGHLTDYPTVPCTCQPGRWAA